MHPPFYVVDHRIDPETRHPLEERRLVRRSRPEALRFSLPGPGAPLVNTQPAAQALPPVAGQRTTPEPNRLRRLRDLFIFWRPA